MITIKRCAVCAEPFITTRRHQQTDTATCRQRLSRLRRGTATPTDRDPAGRDATGTKARSATRTRRHSKINSEPGATAAPSWVPLVSDAAMIQATGGGGFSVTPDPVSDAARRRAARHEDRRAAGLAGPVQELIVSPVSMTRCVAAACTMARALAIHPKA